MQRILLARKHHNIFSIIPKRRSFFGGPETSDCTLISRFCAGVGIIFSTGFCAGFFFRHSYPPKNDNNDN